MKYLLNLKNISALAYVKRVNFILFGAALLYMTSSLLCSCSGNSKGNADNDSNGTETVEQQSGEPEKSEKEQALETASTQMSRLSYTIKPKKDTKEIKTYVNKDGYMDVKWIFNSGSFNLFPFAREIS